MELLNFPRRSTEIFIRHRVWFWFIGRSVVGLRGQYWVGCDISRGMLNHAVERAVEGDVLELGHRHGVPFRPGVFDGCVSISAIQWLCNADRAEIRSTQTIENVLFANV